MKYDMADLNKEIKLMNSDDLALLSKLKKKRSHWITTTSTVAVACLGTASLVFSLLIMLKAIRSPKIELFHTIFLDVLSLVCFLLVIRFLTKNRKLNKDLKERKKEILTGVIERKWRVKSGDIEMYEITVRGDEIPLEQNQYEQLEEGEEAIFQLSYHARILLAIEKKTN